MQNPNMKKQLAQMQSQMEELQKELGESEATGTAGGGVVAVTVNGQQHITRVTIAPEALEEGAELLEELVMAACNEALNQSRDQAAAQMSKLTARLGLPPGLF